MKFILGVPINTSNICAQTELGVKSFRQHLYERQLEFYFRVLYLPSWRWVHQALLEHLSGAWKSPYLEYISSIRSKIRIYSAVSNPKVWRDQISKYFLTRTNETTSKLKYILPIQTFLRCPYVCESKWATVITEFKFENEGLGNKHPRTGKSMQPVCPLCPFIEPNNGVHLIISCRSLSKLRNKTGITRFINLCKLKGYSSEETYSMFVNGQDSNKTQISKSDYVERGKWLQEMRKWWLSKW